MPSSRSVCLGFALVACLCGALPARSITLTLSTDSVAVGELTPGASVAIFKVARVPGNFIGTIVSSRDLLVDEDGDGVVELELAEPLPYRSIWAAVEQGSGEVALATPAGYPLRTLDASRLDLGAMSGGEGAPDLILGPGEFYELLLVRPGEGAWGATVYDGNPDDADGAFTQAVAVAPASLLSLGKEEAAGPEVLTAGDVIVGIDANEMTVFVVTVAGVEAK